MGNDGVAPFDAVPILSLDASDAGVDGAVSEVDEDLEEMEETLVPWASGEGTGEGRGGRP